MKISPFHYSNNTFKAATVSINAISDTHGELFLANSAIEEMKKRKEDIFCKQEKGKENVLAICGDWFMNGGKKGYVTSPDKPLAKFQLSILNEFINQVKLIANNTKTIFVPGNHEFDGGVDLFDDTISQLNADIIATNINIEKSPALSKTKQAKKLFNERILEVEDDKNPELKHKILFLGILPVNMEMYRKELNGLSLTDNSNKNLARIDEKDYQKTLDKCQSRIHQFKAENPNGVVVLMCHAGANFSDNLAAKAPIDIVFDGHEHKSETRYVNNTPIIPLYQNFQKMVNAKINIDDNGKLKTIETISFNPSKNETEGAISQLFYDLFKQDITKKYAIKATNKNITTLDVKGIREGNNFLANFVTDAILHQLQKKDSSIDIFAINSSAIRHPLTISDDAQISHFDIINVLAGINENAGEILTTDVSGLELAYLVRDNIIFNSHEPQKNPIIQYSGIEIDKTAIIKAVKSGKYLIDIIPFIIDTKTGKPIEPDKNYKIANVEKYFDKSRNVEIKFLKTISTRTELTVHSLFNAYFEEEKDNLIAKCDTRIK